MSDCKSLTDNFFGRTYSYGVFYLKISCREKNEIEDCNPVADYYDGSAHYIRRDLVTDDGNIDYKKLLEDTDPTNSICNPANHEVK